MGIYANRDNWHICIIFAFWHYLSSFINALNTELHCTVAPSICSVPPGFVIHPCQASRVCRLVLVPFTLYQYDCCQLGYRPFRFMWIEIMAGFRVNRGQRVNETSKVTYFVANSD